MWNKDKKRNKIKGFWYKNSPSFGSSQRTEFETLNLNSIETVDFRNAFDTKKKYHDVVNEEIKIKSFIDLQQKLLLIYSEFSVLVKNINDIKTLLSKNNSIIKKAVNFLRAITDYSIQHIDDLVDRDYLTIIHLNDLEGSISKSVEKDGNCFYRAIAEILLGSEKYYYIVKICILFILLDNKETMSEILLANSNQISLEEIILSHCKKNKWADEIIQIASSILLHKSIYIVTVDNNNNSFRPHRNKFEAFPNHSNPIVIGYHNYHFVPFLRSSIEIYKMPFSLVETDILLKFRKKFVKKIFNH